MPRSLLVALVQPLAPEKQEIQLTCPVFVSLHHFLFGGNPERVNFFFFCATYNLRQRAAKMDGLHLSPASEVDFV